MVALAEKARGEGLLALEAGGRRRQRPVPGQALQNIADGTDAEELRILLEDEIATTARERPRRRQVLRDPGRLRPHRRHHRHRRLPHPRPREPLGHPDDLGPMIASAFVATLWGLLSRQLHLAAVRLPARPAVRARDRAHDAAHGRRARGAGRQPSRCSSAERLRAMVPERGGSREPPKGRARRTRRAERGEAREPPSSARKKPEEHHVDERWMASYMDMVTVLMCMFIVLFAMSTVDAGASSSSSATPWRPASAAEGDASGGHRRGHRGAAASCAKRGPRSGRSADLALAAPGGRPNSTPLKEQMHAGLSAAGPAARTWSSMIDQRGLTVKLVGSQTFFETGQRRR